MTKQCLMESSHFGKTIFIIVVEWRGCIVGLGFCFVSRSPLPPTFFPGDIILSKALAKMNSLLIRKFGDSPDQIVGLQGAMWGGKTQQGM